ncbi:hypothetical protein [Octadecabacter antarcticus]|uniref:hypothetical protein n=1 Tax=Octadecabacter antarcticus TaxID=1217908 RepID=UPI0011818861|nr:hypothetical protein [Octadecabacter antarcticus]
MTRAQTTDEQKGLILSILADMAESDDLKSYTDHVGFDVSALSGSKDLPAAWVAHYWLGQGTYDVDRATMDLLTWPPIARRVFELQQCLAK